MATAFSVFLRFAEDSVGEGEVGAIVGTVIFTILLVLPVVSLVCQPQNPTKLSFKVNYARDTVSIFILLLFFVCCYTVRPVTMMNFVVCLRSSTSPCSFWCSVVSVGQVADLYSVVWSSPPHGQVANSTIFSLSCIWAFIWLCPVLSHIIFTCSGILRRW